MRSISVLGLVALLGATSCTSEEAAAPAAPTPAVLVCEMPVEAPHGFEKITSEQVEQGPTVGVRTFYSAPNGRHIVYTAGVLMDFFEEPPETEVRLADGTDGWLFSGSGKKWILFWYQDDSCKQFSIGGQGFTRSQFIGQMRELGMLPAG
jgi:hypothetical protein